MPITFTKEDKARIDKALSAIADAKREMAKAKSAGIDVSVQEASINESESKLLAIKRVYFPG